MIEAILLSTTRVMTFRNRQALTAASGFYFASGERLFLVTNRHVLCDEASQHQPDRIEIDLHHDPDNLTRCTVLSIMLYKGGKAIWRQAQDAGGAVDVAVIELDRTRFSPSTLYKCFTPAHLQRDLQDVEVGQSVLVVGFPLGFHDTLHHLPVVRQAIIASSFGLRFQGQGYFLTDARTHRGTSGAPVVMRRAPAPGQDQGKEQEDLPWTLLGIHASRMDMGNRDARVDELLGLNCAWYADVLLTLTA
jgi:S1-C subfamily serine protease